MAKTRTEVAERLESMAKPGGLLYSVGRRATSVIYRNDPLRDLVLEEIQNEYLARQATVTNGGRCAVVTAGPPGAGKSTLVRAAADDLGAGFRIIDPDIIKDMLLIRGAEDEIFDDLLERLLPDDMPIMLRELSGLVHVESVRIADDLRLECLARGEDVVIEGTLGWEPHVDALLHDLTDFGYRQLTVLAAEVPLDEARKRARSRWWKARNSGDIHGGRFVPAVAIEHLYPVELESSICLANASRLYEYAVDTAIELVELRKNIDGVVLEERRTRS